MIPRAPTLDALREIMVVCTRCDLSLSRRQVVPGAGPADAPVLIVGEAPGRLEDEQGIPFVGRSGELLERMLAHAGLHRADMFIANVVRCRPPANRTPRSAEIRACAGWLREQIRLIEPQVVVTLGRFALQHFLPGSLISGVQGELRWVRYGDRSLALYPLLHPAAVIRNRTLEPAYAAQFARLVDILRIIQEGGAHETPS